MPEHEVVCCVADLRAIHEQADVMGIGMFAAFLEAVVDGVKTGIAAIFAIMDALVHLGCLVFMNV
jgi:hypothetical protein